MNQKDYRDAFSRIMPSEAFREQLMGQIQKAQPAQADPSKIRSWAPVMSRHSRRIWAACASGVLLMLLFIGIRPLVSSTPLIKPTVTVPATAQTSSATGPSISAATSASGTNPGQPTPAMNPTATGTAGPSGTLPYSSLRLTDSAAIRLPSQLTQGSLTDRMRPGNYADALKERANLVVKATVMQVRLKQYSIRFQVKPSDYKAFLTAEENKFRHKTIHTVVFNVRIDDIYRDAGPASIAAGDSLIIEQELYPMDSDDPFLLPRSGRQYILALNRRENLDLIFPAEKALYDGVDGEHLAEGRYHLLHDQTPQIERTLDGGYLFYADPSVTMKGSKLQGAGWTSLINSKAQKIAMPDSADSSYRNNMWCRTDAGFETDLKVMLG